MLVQSWRKLTDLEEDNLQGFPNKEISKSKILDTVYAVRCSENIDKNSIEEWLQSDTCKMDFQHMTDKCVEEGGEDENEIHTALGRSLKSSQKQVTITNYSQNKCFVW
jgi:hypothetical protein